MGVSIWSELPGVRNQEAFVWAPGFKNIWGRSMKKALAETELTESFREHDLRAKVASDLDTLQQAQEQLAHSDSKVTNKHYRRKGTVVQPAKGFFKGAD